MKCIIIEDELPARNLIESYCQKVAFLSLEMSFCKPSDALEFLDKQSVDLIITDINMPGMSGLEFAKSISPGPQLIFTTAYQEYAIDGFELSATDYLLKPISFDRFLKSISKAKERFDSSNDFSLKKDFITVKADHKLYKIKFDDIKYIEGQREYVSFYTPSGRITALLSLKNLELNLPSQLFMRCHKSYIIHKEKVSTLEGTHLRIDDTLIPIGQSYRDNVISEVF